MIFWGAQQEIGGREEVEWGREGEENEWVESRKGVEGRGQDIEGVETWAQRERSEAGQQEEENTEVEGK